MTLSVDLKTTSLFRPSFLLLLSSFLLNLSCNLYRSTPTEKISKPDTPVQETKKPEVQSSRQCIEPASPSEHSIFSIIINGLDVGREVRTDIRENGPFGIERVISSHTVWQINMGALEFENHTIKVERTLLDSSILLRGSFVEKKQDRADTAVVGYDGEIWNRLSQTTLLTNGKEKSHIQEIGLGDVDVVGFLVFDLLRDVAIGKRIAPEKLKYYEPRFDRPAEISISGPVAGETDLHGQTISGSWVEVRPIGADRIAIKAFFDKNGTLWEEQYPILGEVHRRLSGPLTLSEEKAELVPELKSNAYLGDPENATTALFRLSSTPDRLKELEILEQPVNQRFVRKDPVEFILEVRAGAPDGNDQPVPEDLASNEYILPRAQEIKSALRYLRSAGKRGHLPKLRRYNSTSVISRASLIQNPKLFWSNPDQVAGLIMDYVYSLLPDKRRVPMYDAVKALSEGSGDCTEHAVLFASLMRAHGIPTRIVAGFHLSFGGTWEYHMWNSYWNKNSWVPIDPSSVVYKPGALYVAIGRGISSFEERRDSLDDFINNKFKGIRFDLIEAFNNGVTMPLAKPRSPDESFVHSALFNASALLDRGDYEGALSLIEKNIPKKGRSISVKLLLADLLSKTDRCLEALDLANTLRQETSSKINTENLDMIELDCLIATRRMDEAKVSYERIVNNISSDQGQFKAFVQAKYFVGLGDKKSALDLLSKAIEEYPDDALLLWTYADYAASSDLHPPRELLEKAADAASRAVMETMSSNCEALLSLAKVLFKSGKVKEAGWILDHALILAPRDKSLRELRITIMSDECSSFQN